MKERIDQKKKLAKISPEITRINGAQSTSVKSNAGTEESLLGVYKEFTRARVMAG